MYGVMVAFQAPPLAKFTLVAGILCALGLAALGYLSPLHYLSTFNETQMKLVFSNEDNTTWAIVCRLVAVLGQILTAPK